VRFDDDADAFNRHGSLWAYIDTHGRVILKPQFFSAKPFHNGLAEVTLAEDTRRELTPWAYINRSGEIVAKQVQHVIQGVSASGDYYSEIPIELNSEPKGAIVYLIPIYDWENAPDMMYDDRKLARYRVSQGNTNVETKQPQKVFKGVFDLRGRKIVIDVDVQPDGNKTFKVNFQ
jgi:hypothetical protein